MNATCTVPGERYYYLFENIDESSDELSTAEAEAPETLENYEKPPAGNPKFWRRQFGNVVTAKQRKFDWVMGVILPMVCFYFDPGVFRDWNSEYPSRALLGAYQLPAYVLAWAAIMAQSAWLLWGDWLGSFRILIGLILGTAAVVSLVIGVVLLPFSLLGTIVLIGLLGFTPLFSAIVYGRNAVRAMRPPQVG
jgi:hypothetical protein